MKSLFKYILLVLAFCIFLFINVITAQEDCPPDPCDGAFCQSGLFECTWMGTATIKVVPYLWEFTTLPAAFEVTCESNAAHSTCLFWMARCEALKGCCATPSCYDVTTCPRFPADSLNELGFDGFEATPAIRDRIAREGCCFGPRHEIKLSNVNEAFSSFDFPGTPDFCVSCCDQVTIEFIAYGPAHYFSTSASLLNDSCASISECFYTIDPVTGNKISCPSGVGIWEVEEDYCCGCPTV